MTIEIQSRVCARPDVFATSVDDELVLFDPQQGSYYGAGAVGERIWTLIAKSRSVDAICSELTSQFDVDRSTCETDVIAFLKELDTRGLISVS